MIITQLIRLPHHEGMVKYVIFSFKLELTLSRSISERGTSD